MSRSCARNSPTGRCSESWPLTRPGRTCQPRSTARPVPTLRTPIIRYTTPSSWCARPCPPSTRNHRCSTNGTFSTGSSRRDPTSTGRIPASSARSATRADRFDDRTAENVASASTSVPPAVASDEIVAQSVIRRTYATPRASSPTVVGTHDGPRSLGEHLRGFGHQARHHGAGRLDAGDHRQRLARPHRLLLDIGLGWDGGVLRTFGVGPRADLV